MLIIISSKLIDFVVGLGGSGIFVLLLILNYPNVFWEVLANLPKLANLLLEYLPRITFLFLIFFVLFTV